MSNSLLKYINNKGLGTGIESVQDKSDKQIYQKNNLKMIDPRNGTYIRSTLVSNGSSAQVIETLPNSELTLIGINTSSSVTTGTNFSVQNTMNPYDTSLNTVVRIDGLAAGISTNRMLSTPGSSNMIKATTGANCLGIILEKIK